MIRPIIPQGVQGHGARSGPFVWGPRELAGQTLHSCGPPRNTTAVRTNEHDMPEKMGVTVNVVINNKVAIWDQGAQGSSCSSVDTEVSGICKGH